MSTVEAGTTHCKLWDDGIYGVAVCVQSLAQYLGQRGCPRGN